jgi:hypothetical protein
MGNDKIFFIPSGDFYLLAALNSPIMWWRNWRALTHLKDEALSPMGYMMDVMPIADPGEHLRDQIVNLTPHLPSIYNEKHTLTAAWLDWLQVQHEIAKPKRTLIQPFGLSLDALVETIREARGPRKPLTVAAIRNIRAEHAATIAPMQAKLAEVVGLERRISDLVNQAYGLTPEEIHLMWRTSPPRMPLASAAIEEDEIEFDDEDEAEVEAG